MIYNQHQFNQYHLGILQHQHNQQFINQQHENVYQAPYMIQHPHIIHHPVRPNLKYC